MIVEPTFLSKINDNESLWKYMDLYKFESLIKGKLYFRRLDLFEKEFEECVLTDYDKKLFKSHYISDDYLSNDWQRYYINCWHLAKEESTHMWNSFVKEDGIAIKTTAKKIRECFNDNDYNIYFAKINYIDYSSDTSLIPGNPINMYMIPFTKKQNLSNENEARLLIHTNNYSNNEHIDLDITPNTLIDKIVISPKSTHIKPKIEDIIKRYNINTKIEYSSLESK